jgi:hypothetical protein
MLQAVSSDTGLNFSQLNAMELSPVRLSTGTRLLATVEPWVGTGCHRTPEGER